MLKAPDCSKGERVTCPDWAGHRRSGVIVEIANGWHMDVLFDGWDHPVRISRFGNVVLETPRKAA